MCRSTLRQRNTPPGIMPQLLQPAGKRFQSTATAMLAMPPSMRSEVFAGVLLEGIFAAYRTKVIGSTFMLRLCGRLSFLNIHSTYGILLHLFNPSFPGKESSLSGDDRAVQLHFPTGTLRSFPSSPGRKAYFLVSSVCQE